MMILAISQVHHSIRESVVDFFLPRVFNFVFLYGALAFVLLSVLFIALLTSFAAVLVGRW